MLVVDASVLAPVLADAGGDGRRFRARLHGETIVGPDLLRVQVTSVLRRQANLGELTPEQADAAISDLLEFPIRVFPTAPLLRRVWELRQNLTAHDGCYVALAEAIDSPLVTADRRLANAPGLRCVVEVLGLRIRRAGPGDDRSRTKIPTAEGVSRSPRAGFGWCLRRSV